MTPTAKVLSIAAAAAAVVLVLLLLRAGEPTPPASGDRIARAAPAAGGVYREPAIADPTGVARTSVASVDASPAVDLSHPYEFALRCRVVDRDGLPVVGAKLGFNLRDHTPNLWPTPTDRDGSVELRWRGRVERLTMAIGLLMHGRGLALREVSVRAGASQQIELLADFGGAGDGPCEAGSRRPEVACRRCHQGPVLPEVFTPRLDLLTRLHPETSLADRLAAVIVADADAVPPSPPEEEEVSLSDITEGASDEFGTITGLVLGAENRPVAGATVAWGHTADRPEDRVRTRADGTFELQLVEPGDVVVRAGGGAAGLATAPLRVFGGQVANCTLQLLRGRVLTGRVLLPDGASPADWRVHFVGSPGALPDGTLVRSDGRFELANLPPGVGQLLLAGPVDARLPFATAANARTDGDEVVFDLRATGVPAGLLRLPPDSGAVDLWVWQRESGCGAAARQLPDGSFELGMLASGNYTVVAAGEVFGTVSLGEIWIDGRGVTELGPLSQPSPGELVLPEPVSRGRIELYRRLPELDLCAHLPTLKGGERLRLPAGRWLLLSGEPGAPMAREFEVAAGRVVELDAGAGGPR